MRKINYHSMKEQTQMRLDYGEHNDLPPNFKMITEEEFVKSKFFIYIPDHILFKQVVIEELGPAINNVYLYVFWDGTGVCILRDYKAGKVLYASFAKCEHTYQELSPTEAKAKGQVHHGMCYYVLECTKCGTKCGFISSYDSSG